MKSELRVVIDTNIFISALLKSKNCLAIYENLKQGNFHLLTTDEMINELVISSERSKFDFLEDDKKELQEVIRESVEIVKPSEKVFICRDPKDNIVLECALSGKANFIVTGDKDLLVLKKFKNISIITPQKFIKQLSGSVKGIKIL